MRSVTLENKCVLTFDFHLVQDLLICFIGGCLGGCHYASGLIPAFLSVCFHDEVSGHLKKPLETHLFPVTKRDVEMLAFVTSYLLSTA